MLGRRRFSKIQTAVVVATVLLMAGAMMGGPALAQQSGSKRFPERLIADSPGAEAASAEMGPVRFNNFNLITITSGTTATPYPSNISVGGWCPGTVTDVDVTLNSFGSAFPDDVDILLVGPGGQKVVIMSDAGDGTSVEDLFITLDDEAASPVPDAAALTTGTFKPADYEVGETFAAPAPGPPYASALSAFDGTNPNGTWSLYIMDELGIFSPGDVEVGWSLEINVATSPSGTRVCIPHAGLGEPYPSEQTISGRASPIQDVNVTLSGLTHSFPDDLDILLQGPGGQNAMLMSDAGGSLDVNNVNLTLDDEASTSLPDNAQITSGTYKPTNFETLENLPAPAPATAGTSLGVFDGTNPNGAWRLFVRDDIGEDQGILSGWTLQITTPQATVTVKGGKVREGKNRSFTITRTANIGLVETVSYKTKNGSAKKGKDYKAVAGTLTFAAGESSKKVKVKTKDDSLDERTEKFFLTATAAGVTSQGAARIRDND